MTTMTIDTDLSPVTFDVEPLLFGPDHERATDPAAADYWTVYTCDKNHHAQARADVRNLTDALMWISIVTEHDAPVSVRVGDAWLSITVAPINGSHRAVSTLAALLYDVDAAELADPVANAARLKVEWNAAFAALRAAGLEADADDPIAEAYRAASDAVNHANRRKESRTT